MLTDFDLIDGQLGEREAMRCFMFSRMRVIKEGLRSGRAKVLQLSFEDMLEAIVRLAMLKALPIDSDLGGEIERPPEGELNMLAERSAEWSRRCQAMGCADAGELMLRLQAEGSAAWAAFLEARAPVTVGGMPGTPMQPTERAVHHLCCYLMRCVHVVAPGDQAARRRDAAEWRLDKGMVKGFAKAGGKKRYKKVAVA